MRPDWLDSEEKTSERVLHNSLHTVAAGSSGAAYERGMAEWKSEQGWQMNLSVDKCERLESCLDGAGRGREAMAFAGLQRPSVHHSTDHTSPELFVYPLVFPMRRLGAP